jgi:HD-GYP domain-containing protein (c-di-GMP phosphodiesterase class II)
MPQYGGLTNSMDQNDFHTKFSQALTLLTAAVTNVGLYPPTHPQVAPYIDKAHECLSALLEDNPQVTVLLIDEDLISNNRKLVFSASSGKALAKVLKKKGLGRITFITGLPRSHLELLIQNLASVEVKALKSTSCIKLGRIEMAKDAGGEGKQEADAGHDSTLDEQISDFIAFREHGLSQMCELYNRIKEGERMDIKVINGIVSEFVRRFRREMNPLSLLASIKSHDEYTFVHVTNVALLVMCQAEGLGFSGTNLHDIGVAALLHDAGKLIISEAIVSKPAALTRDERLVMEQHTSLGAQYLINQKEIPGLALVSALEHHIRFDGGGYPAIPGKWRPHIVSQMITVGDVFDAMRSRRPYRDAIPQPEIITTMRKLSGEVFNPMLLDFFLRLIER